MFILQMSELEFRDSYFLRTPAESISNYMYTNNPWRAQIDPSLAETDTEEEEEEEEDMTGNIHITWNQWVYTDSYLFRASDPTLTDTDEEEED
jgi:hypothetical protein